MLVATAIPPREPPSHLVVPNDCVVCVVCGAGQLLEEARLRAEREALEAEEAKKNKRKRRPAAPWKSLGSEVEIEAARAKPTREPLVVQISRRRREFKAPYKFTDKDSQELWNSSQVRGAPGVGGWERRSRRPLASSVRARHQRSWDASGGKISGGKISCASDQSGVSNSSARARRMILVSACEAGCDQVEASLDNNFASPMHCGFPERVGGI